MKGSAEHPGAATPPTRPLLCVLINQLAFPGMGTLMAQRGLVGYLQASIMVIGFCLTMAFMLRYLSAIYHLASNPQVTESQFYAAYRPYAWARDYGLLACAVAWLWSFYSSVRILRSARRSPPPLPPK